MPLPRRSRPGRCLGSRMHLLASEPASGDSSSSPIWSASGWPPCKAAGCHGGPAMRRWERRGLRSLPIFRLFLQRSDRSSAYPAGYCTSPGPWGSRSPCSGEGRECLRIRSAMSPRASALINRRTPTGAPTLMPTMNGEAVDTALWARTKGMRRMRAALQSSLLFPALSSFCRVSVGDRELLRNLTRPAEFVADHVSALDAVVLAEALPPRYRHRSVVVAAADSIFKRKWEARLAQVTDDAVP